MQNWNEVKTIIEEPKKVVVLSHRSPDGDSIGSSLAINALLKQLNQSVQVITPDPAPAFLSWMSDFDSMINFEKNTDEVIEKIDAADLIICLDFNTLSRMGKGLEELVLQNTKAYILNIDHHQEPDDFAHFQLSDTKASSTAQLVFEFTQKLSLGHLVNKAMGECIYTGILTDTGSFRFSSTSSNTHKVVAELMEVGVQPSEIHERVYNNYSADRIKLLGFALSERMNIYSKYNTGIIYLSQTDLNAFDFKKGDTEGLVNYPLSIGSIKASILITEKDGKVKMSFRSKGDFHINKIASEHFNGGGHLNAAGGISDLSVMDTVKKLEDILEGYAEELQS